MIKKTMASSKATKHKISAMIGCRHRGFSANRVYVQSQARQARLAEEKTQSNDHPATSNSSVAAPNHPYFEATLPIVTWGPT